MPGDKKFPYSGRIACMDDSSSGYASQGAGSTSTRHFQKVSLPLWEHHCLRLLHPVFFGTFKRQIRSFLGFLQCDFYYFLLIASQIWICPLVFWVHACWENVFTSACVSSAYLLLQKDLMRSCLCLTSFGFFVWVDASMLLGSQALSASEERLEWCPWTCSGEALCTSFCLGCSNWNERDVWVCEWPNTEVHRDIKKFCYRMRGFGWVQKTAFSIEPESG